MRKHQLSGWLRRELSALGAARVGEYRQSSCIGFQGAKETNEMARQHWLDDLTCLTKNYKAKAKVPSAKWPRVPAA